MDFDNVRSVACIDREELDVTIIEMDSRVQQSLQCRDNKRVLLRCGFDYGRGTRTRNDDRRRIVVNRSLVFAKKRVGIRVGLDLRD